MRTQQRNHARIVETAWTYDHRIVRHCEAILLMIRGDDGGWWTSTDAARNAASRLMGATQFPSAYTANLNNG
jgi:hypothetical protein